MQKESKSHLQIHGWIPNLSQTVAQRHGSQLLALLLVSSYPLAGSTVSVSSRTIIKHISSNSILHLKSLGFLPYKVDDLHSIKSNLLTTIVFFMLFGGPFVGKIFDDYGPRSLLFVGAFLHVFGLMMVSISKKYYQFLLSQAVCSALGASMVFYPAFTCVSSDSDSDHTSLIGLLGINLVLQEARRCPRPRCSWIILRRCHSSHHGRSSDSRGRLRLGIAYLRFPDIGTAHFRKFNCSLSHRTNEASIQPNGFHPSSEGADFLTFDRGHLLLLL
jgi:hypothetical protein